LDGEATGWQLQLVAFCCRGAHQRSSSGGDGGHLSASWQDIFKIKNQTFKRKKTDTPILWEKCLAEFAHGRVTAKLDKKVIQH
jgi:hypothetical protein